MAEKLGDVKISVIFESGAAARNIRAMADAMAKVKGEADKDVTALRNLAKELDRVQTEGQQASGAINQVTESTKKSSKATEDFASRMAKFNLAIEGVQRIFGLWKNSLSGLVQASNELISSQLQLEAQAKLAGIPFSFLQSTAEQAKKEFKLSTEQANRFTIGITRLTAKSGDIQKTQQAITSLLDLAAARGYTATQALEALNQVLAEQDEGTDKLFGKNPSIIYAEWAKKTGNAVGKMDDLQKAMALVDATLESGGKVRGYYLKYLESAAGKQEQTNIALREMAQSFGQLANAGLAPLLGPFKALVQFITQLPRWIQAVIGVAALATATFVSLHVTGLLPLIQKGIPLLIAGLSRLSIALGALGGPVGLILSVATVLGILAWSHRDAAAAANDQAKASAELANVQSQVLTETIGLNEKEIQQLLDKADAQRKFFKSVTDFQGKKLVPGPEGTFSLYEPAEFEKLFPGGDLSALDEKIKAYQDRLEFLKKINRDAVENTKLTAKNLLALTTPEQQKPIVPLGYEAEKYRKTPQIISDLIGTQEQLDQSEVTMQDWLTRVDDYFVEFYDHAKALQNEFQAFFVSSMQQVITGISNSVSGLEVEFDDLFKRLKSGLISLGINIALNYASGGLWGLVSGFGGIGSKTVPRSTVGGGQTQSFGTDLALLRADLRAMTKSGGGNVIIQGSLPGQEFYVKSVLGQKIRADKHVF